MFCLTISHRIQEHFKKPPKNILKEIGNRGHYWHQGLEYCIKKSLSRFKIRNIQNSTLPLNIDLDGLPIYNNSKQEFWPILANIHELPFIKPIVIGIHHG